MILSKNFDIEIPFWLQARKNMVNKTQICNVEIGIEENIKFVKNERSN